MEPADYKKFTMDTGIVGISNALIKLKDLFPILIVAKFLGAIDYGIFTIVMVTVAFLAPLAPLGINHALMRFLPPEKNENKIKDSVYSAFLITIVASFIFSLAVFILSDMIAISFLGSKVAGEFIRIGSALIFITAINMLFLDVFRSFGMMKKYSFVGLVQTFGEIALAFVFILYGFGLLFVLYAYLITRAFVLVLSFVFIVKEVKLKIPDFGATRAYLNYGIHLLITGICFWIIGSSNRYIIGYFMDTESIGIYSVAYMIGSMIMIFMIPITINLLANGSILYDRGNFGELKKYFKYSVKYFMMLAMPTLFLFSVLSEKIIRILASIEFVSRGAVIIPFITLGFIFYVLWMFGTFILSFAKKTGKMSMVIASASVINIAMNIVLVPYMGILGAAVSTLITFLLMFLVITKISIKILRFNVPWGFIIKSLLVSILMGVLIFLINPVSFAEVVVWGIVAYLIYFALIFALKGFNKKEIELFRSLVFG